MTRLPAIIVTTLLSFVGTQLYGVISISSGSAILSDISGTNPDFSIDGLDSDTEIFIFQEQYSLALAQDLIVDITVPDTYDNDDYAALDASSSEVISAGTIVDSYIIHVAPETLTVDYVAAGSITFGHDVLGIIVTYNKLVATDSILGASNATYLPEPQYRHSLEPSDIFTLTADRRTLILDQVRTIDFAVDQMRIITAVPEPSSYVLICMVFAFGFVVFRRK